LKKKINKKVRNATRVSKGSLKFRSKLELFTYEQLKLNSIPFNYEKDRFVIIDSFKYKSDCHEKKKRKGKNSFVKVSNKISQATYLPDFTNTEDGWIIECKGLRTEAFNLRWKLFKNYLAKNNLNYDLYMPGTKKQVLVTVQLIKNKFGYAKRTTK
tara:strand:+ start:2143 stop:2610 length:468 start_codon:yes stop_codon:yes gene_type:complete